MKKHRNRLVSGFVVVVGAIAATPAAVAQELTPGYCDVETMRDALLVRPASGEPVIDDINWFARPVPNPDGDWIVGYAMHDLNYLYNLTTGERVRIPDKSDAVATPDGKYMTVPSMYTPNGYTRFYDTSVLLDHLDRGKDASEVEPVFIHRHEGLKQSFYQSLGKLDSDDGADVYRMIFSGTMNESGFRMVDYRFETSGGDVLVTPSEPMPLCPEIENDLMTPFISKDGQYVASYTSPVTGEQYADGASLKVYQLTNVDYARKTSACNEVVDFGFAAGKADFSFDGNSIAFHISNVSYLAVFISGGDVYGASDTPGVLNTDVLVADLTRDERGIINGTTGIRRLTNSTDIGAGSYFPAFFPDGKLFFISHSDDLATNEPRFEFRVVDPAGGPYDRNLFGDADAATSMQEIGRLWTASCLDAGDHEFAAHELPYFVYGMTAAQCRALVQDTADAERARLSRTCDAILN